MSRARKYQARKVSIVIPVHNEEDVLEAALDRLFLFCKKRQINAEVLICENGSIDATKSILRRYSHPALKSLFLKTRGLGAAYKQGIAAATGEIIYFTGIDFPFGYQNILDSLAYIGPNDLVFSSKAHPKSVIRAPIHRKFVSFAFRAIMKALLPININDPQGCLTAKAEALKDIAQYCDSSGAFFQTQTALYANLLGYKSVEIPVSYLNPRKGTKFAIGKDGAKILHQMVEERRRYRQKMVIGSKAKSLKSSSRGSGVNDA